MGGAASLIQDASLIPDKIDIDSFRTLSGDKFTQEVFDTLKDENGFISQSVLLDLNTVYSRLPRFTGVVPIYQKQNMQPLAEAELPNLLKEVGLLPTVEGLSTQAKDGKLSFGDFLSIVKERLSNIDTAVFDAFEMFDINRDGRISKEEMKTVYAKLQEPFLDEGVESLIKNNDIDGDGKVSMEEYTIDNNTQAAKEEFEKLDIDRDGYITKAEMKTFVAQQWDAYFNESVDATVQEADIDSDGFINIEEFQKSVYPTLSTMIKSKSQEIAKKMREENKSLENFKIFDVDGDGFVTADEIKAVMNKLGISVTDSAVAAIVKAADVDGDGRISLKEI